MDSEDAAVAKSKLIALKDTLTSCDTLKDDIEAIEGVEQADMGEIKSSDLTDEVLAVLSSTDVGTLGDPIERPGGAVSIMVCSREASGSDIPTRDAIENRLMDQQLAQASKRHLRDLRRSATVVVR